MGVRQQEGTLNTIFLITSTHDLTSVLPGGIFLRRFSNIDKFPACNNILIGCL